MAQPGAVPQDTAGEISVPITAAIPMDDLEEAKRTVRRIERNAHKLVQDLTHLTEVLPGLNIKVSVSSRREE